MKSAILVFLTIFLTSDLGISLNFVTAIQSLQCPVNWIKYEKRSWNKKNYFSCYKLVKSPKKNIHGAIEVCQSYQSRLMSFDASDDYAEHIFMKRYLSETDPQRRSWYIGVFLTSLGGIGGIWEADDGKRLPPPLMKEFLPEQILTDNKRYLTYSYSHSLEEWGFLMVHGNESKEFICELSSEDLSNVLLDPEDILTQEYGIRVRDPKYLPRGPKITRQPDEVTFDLLKRDTFNQVSLKCIADSYPFPKYDWFKDPQHSLLNSSKVNPFKDSRVTVSGGTLIIINPNEIDDRANYYCKASNTFGSVVSASVALSFAYIGEFNLLRSRETGNQYWGKAIYCDPPRFYPDARFYWNRNFFPNFVEENERTLVSRDGNLYFSFLDRIDEGSYSCTAQNSFSDIGRHGPLFKLEVELQSNYQQLTFANNFPKLFPASPVSGDEVTIECLAFGYPLASYSWKKRNGDLPDKSLLLSFSKVLVIPNVQLQDIGDYVCMVQNDKMALEAQVTLSIQTKPSFTFPIRDKYVSVGDDVTMICEAFSIPDAEYSWLRNSQPIPKGLPKRIKEKYFIKDNVLKIMNASYEDEAMYQCRATNMLGSSLSTAQLKILAVAPTFFDDETKNQFYAVESLSITIPCRPEASPIPKVSWLKNHQVIENLGGRQTVLESGDLQIFPVDQSDAGDYSCIAANMFNSSTAVRNLKILGRPPELRNETLVATVGEDLTLGCNLFMDDEIEVVYIWRINNLKIKVEEMVPILQDSTNKDLYFPSSEMLPPPTDEDHRIRNPPYLMGDDSTILIIRSISLQDAGLYSCESKTPISIFSHWTELLVNGPPGPVGGIMVTDVTSTSAKLRWTNGYENGSPIQTYTVLGQMWIHSQWSTKFEIEVSALNTSRIAVKESHLPSRTLVPFSKYRFQVRANNFLGVGEFSHPSSSINTKLDIPFLTPQNIRGGGGNIGDLTVIWDPLTREHQNAPGIYYIVYWRRALEEREQNHVVAFNKQDLKDRGNGGLFVTTVNKKLFYTKYEVKVQSANKVGFGPISRSVFLYSAESYPQAQPTEVRAISYNATALNVTWRPIIPTRENVRGRLLGYRIKYWHDGRNETESRIRLHVNASHHGLVVGLLPNTIYWVRVMAHNSAGSGPESEKFRERTLRYPPLTPPNAVRVTAVDPETVLVTWRGINPSSVEESLLGYKVRIWKDWEDMTAAKDLVVPLGSPLECLISGLDLGQVYKLRVLAFSQGGDGKMSSPSVLFSMGDPFNWTSSATENESLLTFSLTLLLIISFFSQRKLVN